MKCIFAEDGILFSNSKRDVFFPHGCLDSLNMSLLGVMQAVSRAHVCCFTAERQDKAEIKLLMKQAKVAMKTAPAAEPVVVDLENLGMDSSLAPEDRLKQVKGLFVQGVISKEAYDLEKRLLKN